jgi:catechol 2,3-dioxygenase-like lactoylglutathione lyase family enzyme
MSIDDTTTKPPGAGAAGTLSVNHATVVVPDLHAARRRYMDVFGAVFFKELAPSPLVEEDYDLNLFYVADLMIESMAPHGTRATTALTSYLSRYGPGHHFLEFGVADLARARQALLDRGYQLVTDNAVTFTTHPRSTHGLLLGAAEGFMNPPWRSTWTGGNALGLRGLRSINFVVEDLDAATEHLTGIWGGQFLRTSRVTSPEHLRVNHLSFGSPSEWDVRGPHVVALLRPESSDGPAAEFLAARQARYYSLTWTVEDIGAAVRELGRRGIEVTHGASCGEEGAMIAPGALFGARHELVAPDFRVV